MGPKALLRTLQSLTAHLGTEDVEGWTVLGQSPVVGTRYLVVFYQATNYSHTSCA